MRSENNKKKIKINDKNWLEWSVFIVSLLLVFCILGYLVYKSYTHKASKADIHIEFSPSPTKTSPYLYHVLVMNKGGETAEEVKIELVMKKGEIIVEKAELQLPFVPKKSKREGWLNFSQGLAKGDTIEVRVVSFQKP